MMVEFFVCLLLFVFDGAKIRAIFGTAKYLRNFFYF